MVKITSIFSKMFRRKFVHAYYKVLKNNQIFSYEGRKYQKLDATRACTTSWPIVLREFQSSQIVIAIYY